MQAAKPFILGPTLLLTVHTFSSGTNVHLANPAHYKPKFWSNSIIPRWCVPKTMFLWRNNWSLSVEARQKFVIRHIQMMNCIVFNAYFCRIEQIGPHHAIANLSFIANFQPFQAIFRPGTAFHRASNAVIEYDNNIWYIGTEVETFWVILGSIESILGQLYERFMHIFVF